MIGLGFPLDIEDIVGIRVIYLVDGTLVIVASGSSISLGERILVHCLDRLASS